MDGVLVLEAFLGSDGNLRRKPVLAEYIGAQMAVENFESRTTWRLATTSTRNFFGSRAVGFTTR